MTSSADKVVFVPSCEDPTVSKGHDGSPGPDSSAPSFGQAVGFLLSQLGFETARRFGVLMAEVELEPRQFALMRAIAAEEGRSQNEVAESLHIPPSSMVGVIDHLEARGLVERRPHRTDRRSRVLHLTAKGKKVLARATELAMGLEQTICEGLEPAERERLLRMLMDVASNLGLQRGLHPDTSTGHGRPHWTEDAQGPS
jgi:DNA-binding MarR family transcriptional regulator